MSLLWTGRKSESKLPLCLEPAPDDLDYAIAFLKLVGLAGLLLALAAIVEVYLAR